MNGMLASGRETGLKRRLNECKQVGGLSDPDPRGGAVELSLGTEAAGNAGE